MTTEDYHTQLLKPLQILMDQQDRKYHTIQDMITHARKLWQMLDQNKLCQELKKVKEQAHQQHQEFRLSRNSQDSHSHSQPCCQSDKQSNLQQDRKSDMQINTRLRRPQLSDEKYQHCMNKGLCLKCSYSDHMIQNCINSFNSN